MRTKSILLWAVSVISALLLVNPLMADTIVQGPVVDPINGHTLYLISQDTWINSEATAVAMGGNLVTITDSAENAFIYNTFNDGGTRNLWIGFYNPTEDALGGSHVSNFVWVSGGVISYTNWSVGEPNNSVNGEYYAEMWGNSGDISINLGLRQPGTWNDIADSGYYPGLVNSVPYGVVEIVPEPASLILVSLGVAGILIRRRGRYHT